MGGRDTNFYYSFLVLPPDKRHAIVAVWDFCRAVDDAADEVAERIEDACGLEVARWRRRAGRRASTAARRRRRRAARWQPLMARVQPAAPGLRGADRGRRDGLVPRRVRDVRGPLRVLHPRRVRGRPDLPRDLRLQRSGSRKQYATDLGVALQLTNILRDVPGIWSGAASTSRKTRLRQFGCTRRRSRRGDGRRAGSGVRSPAVKALLRHQAQRARDYYRRADAALPRADARRLVAAQIMGAIYRGILDRIERRDYDVFSASSAIPAAAARAHRRARPGRGRPCARDSAPTSSSIGAGFAGLSAAALLAEQGARVLVLEARPQLGGRATAFADRETGELVDNGQHVLFGCYRRNVRVPRADRRGWTTSARSRRSRSPTSTQSGRRIGAALPAAAVAAAPARRRPRLGRAAVAAIACRVLRLAGPLRQGARASCSDHRAASA